MKEKLCQYTQACPDSLQAEFEAHCQKLANHSLVFEKSPQGGGKGLKVEVFASVDPQGANTQLVLEDAEMIQEEFLTF